MASAQRRDIVVIGGSAGALEPLQQLVSALPAEMPATILITLHIPAEYPSLLPELLSKSSKLPVRHPSNHDAISRGEVLIAPPDLHLTVEDGTVVLSRGPRENRHRPAIDVMFRSAARAYGVRVVAVLLSGQLDDGAAGLMSIKMRGGLTIVQDPAEAAAPEMPSRAIQYASPQCIVPVAKISQLLVSAANGIHQLPTATEAVMPDQLSSEVDAANLEKPITHENPGRPSVFACPECHGVLWEVQEGDLLRFRCRVGHAYTADSLRLALSEAGENALWVAMRALEEKAAILRRMSQRSGARLKEHYKQEAEGFDQHAQTIRKMLVENQQLSRKEGQASQGAAD